MTVPFRATEGGSGGRGGAETRAARFRAAYRLSLATDAEARVVAEALRVEAGDPLPKATVTVASAGREVTIRVETEDASALRAATKSFLSWAKGAVQSMRSARGSAPPPPGSGPSARPTRRIGRPPC